MSLDEKLLEKARRSPEHLRFEEALTLTRQLGYAKVRQVARHRVFRRARGAGPVHLLSLQEGARGMAKAYQVERLLEQAAGTRGRPRG
jgi:hypothetical protein